MAHLPNLSETLEAHQLSKELRSSDPACISEQDLLRIPPQDREDTFTTGTCEQCFVQPPVVLVSTKAKQVLAVVYLSEKAMGHRGFVHGGAISTIFDECCGRAALTHFDSVKQAAKVTEVDGVEKQPEPTANGHQTTPSAAVTAQLTVNFVAPTPTKSCILVQAIVDDDSTASTARKAKIRAKMWKLSNTGNPDEDILCAEAQSLFIEPKLK